MHLFFWTLLKLRARNYVPIWSYPREKSIRREITQAPRVAFVRTQYFRWERSGLGILVKGSSIKKIVPLLIFGWVKAFQEKSSCPICPLWPPPPSLLSVFNKAVPKFVTTVMMADGSHWFRAPHLIKGTKTKVSQAQSVLAKIPSVKGYSVKAATEHIWVRETHKHRVGTPKIVLDLS